MYYDSCHISEHLKKKLIKIEFLSSHFNSEDEGKKQYFWHVIILLFQERVKTEMQKKKVCAVFGEDAETECVRSGLQSFILEISAG